MPIAFERATEVVAKQLASFRLGLDCSEPFAYNEHELLCAGHIVGALWAQELLNTGDEKWVEVENIGAQSIATSLKNDHEGR